MAKAAMKIHLRLHLPVLLSCIAAVHADCDSKQPVYTGFTYPEFSTDRACCSTEDCDANGFFCNLFGFITDAEVLAPKDGEIEVKDYDDMGDLQHIDGSPLNPTTVYGADVDTFVTLCEELWACNQYRLQYDDALSSDSTFDYEVRSLCFDRVYDGSTDALDKERASRRTFIIKSCFLQGTDEEGNIAGLQDDRDEACAEAENLSQRLMFDAATSDSISDIGRQFCLEALECAKFETENILTNLGEDLPEDPSIDELYASNSAFAYNNCYAESDESLEGFRNDTCGTSDTSRDRNSLTQGFGGCQSLPLCPSEFEDYFKSFSPDYPTGGGYDAAVASLVGTVITDGKQNRTNADAVGFLLVTKRTLETVKEVFTFSSRASPRAFPYNFLIISPKATIAIIVQAFETVLAQADYQDGLIDAAEIEAWYENTRQLYKSSAAIYDEVVCRCAKDIDTRPRRGYGCDSIDNDCDNDIDELDEDTWPPEIDVGMAIANCGPPSGKSFATDQDAIDCVLRFTEVVDDCDPDVAVDATISPSAVCGSSIVTVTAIDQNQNEASQKQVQIVMKGVPPQVSCSTSTTSIGQTGQGQQVNVGLSYGATAFCGREMTVKAEVFANEFEDFQSQQMARFYKDKSSSSDTAGLYVAATSCTTSSNGQCIEDPDLDTRVYSIVITAKDEVGLEAEPTTCVVVVTPTNGSGTPIDVDSSTQLFLLDSYTSTFS